MICIIAEGSYPYVVGGVSSWIHQLIKGHPEKDFKILSILPSEKDSAEIRYELPENLLVKELRYISLSPENLGRQNIVRFHERLLESQYA